MDGVIPAIQSKYSQRLAEALALQKENLMKAYAEAADGILASFTGVVLGCRTRYEEAVDGMIQEEYRQQEATASALSRLEKQRKRGLAQSRRGERPDLRPRQGCPGRTGPVLAGRLRSGRALDQRRR